MSEDTPVADTPTEVTPEATEKSVEQLTEELKAANEKIAALEAELDQVCQR